MFSKLGNLSTLIDGASQFQYDPTCGYFAHVEKKSTPHEPVYLRAALVLLSVENEYVDEISARKVFRYRVARGFP